MIFNSRSVQVITVLSEETSEIAKIKDFHIMQNTLFEMQNTGPT